MQAALLGSPGLGRPGLSLPLRQLLPQLRQLLLQGGGLGQRGLRALQPVVCVAPLLLEGRLSR